MKYCFRVIVLLVAIQATAQPHRPAPAGEILLQLKKANVLASALYVAAHPDDENTTMLAWLAKEKMARTAYLSCTRGDGGQNLIGPEQAELMGLIRTHELLEARKIDGAEQYFTRANDFGFSKTTEETMQIWDKDKVLADVVWRIRAFRPDVILCRFPPDARAGHGNHSASAVLAEEAFKAAADPNRFPEQLSYLKPWQAKRVVWNTFNFGATSQKPTDKGQFIQVDIGAFNPLLGKGYPEIAAESRSMHKSQGFGSAKNRGMRPEYLLHKDGVPAEKDVFDGIDTGWSRVNGGGAVQEALNNAIQQFKPDNPSAILPYLLTAYQRVQNIGDEYWKEVKKKELEQLIIACTGLWFEANANDYATAAGDNLKVTNTVVKRSEAPIKLEKIKLTVLNQELNPNLVLGNNELSNLPIDITVPKNLPLSQPFWLAQAHAKGLYTVEDVWLRNQPMRTPDLQAEFTFVIDGQTFVFSTPVTYKFTDPVKGEIYRPLEIRPELTANIAEKVYVFSDNKAQKVEITLKSSKEKTKGELVLELPKGWKAEPASIPFDFASKYQEQKFTFMVSPSNRSSDGNIKAIVKTETGSFDKGLLQIQYDHIPPLVYFPDASAKLVKLDIQTKGKNIGYIAGAGDEVPAALQQIGYQVTQLTEAELTKDLSTYDAIVVGVRAYNTEERLKFAQEKLLNYVQNGGTMVVQYLTNFRQVTKEIGPYPIQISRDRVTVEEAPMTFLQPTHPALTTPNKISEKDFDGWVQERGLYFANNWDPKYEALFACNDPGEKPLNGSTLVTKYGKGYYLFTSLSFFRQLPAGVPGAYRLFANFISLGKN